jgi:hypothetical protein
MGRAKRNAEQGPASHEGESEPRLKKPGIERGRDAEPTDKFVISGYDTQHASTKAESIYRLCARLHGDFVLV